MVGPGAAHAAPNLHAPGADFGNASKRRLNQEIRVLRNGRDVPRRRARARVVIDADAR
jgi:hypothetical protein